MSDEHIQQSSSRGKSRRERVEHARSRDILDVANELHMELVQSGRDYRWKEHDSMVLSPEKNMWNWFSRHQGGDVIALVQTMKEVNFNQAIDYLNDGTFKEFQIIERTQESFNYYLAPYEQPFEAARSYLKEKRGLSDETINFFLEKGVLAQANAKVNGSIESVVVFKSFDFSGEIVGATLQGIEENWEKWPERGYAKNIVRNSDGITGMHVDIGQAKRLVFAESAIDLMSYYELNKDNLQDVRLVSMDGLKESVVGRHLAQLQSDISGRPLRWSHDQLAKGLETAIDNNFFSDGKHADWITLAVDNDEAGQNFVSSIRDKGAMVTEALPNLQHGQEKMDWNDTLKSSLSNQISKIDQSEIVEDYQIQVDELIADITKEDTAYYLWHDEELHNLEVEDFVLEEFHGMLEDRKYPVAGADLYVEESINDGATGYLSLEGHVLDRDGILDYLSNHEFSGLEKVEFLTQLQANLPEIWDKVLNHYDSELKTIISKHQLLENRSTDFELLSSAGLGQKEKSLENNQEMDIIFGQQKNAEGTIGDFPENQEAAPLPEANKSQPLNDLLPGQTQPQPLLHFSINKDGQSINRRHYHVISDKDLVKLNRYAGTLQQVANWYLKELSDSKIYYFYQENNSIQTLQVLFDKDKFQHLTGVFPYKEGQSAEQTLEDFANGNGAFDTILLANKGAAFDKLKVLPELPAIVESDSFYFGDLSEVPKLHSLDLDKAIKSGDEDIILALRTVDNTTFPASLMKLRTGLKNQLAQSAEENIILGVYRERAGKIDQLSINEQYVEDGGQEMLSILENKQYEEAIELTQEKVKNDTISAELFTQVLDAAYNVGDPRKLGTDMPEESKAAWKQYYELSDIHDGNFTAVIAAADQQELVDKSSHFYQEWNQDRIYNETYHVRLQRSETWANSPQIPFKETELVEYQTFAEELYKQNKSLYERHQESVGTGNQTDDTKFTNVRFDVYAPGGILIKDNIRYDIGDETEPISRLLGLGYRRLEGQPELAAIDEKILSQLENQEVNLEIATEANEQSLKTQEVLQDEASSHRESFQSPNQEMKAGLDQRIEEIMAEESTKNQVKEGEQDYTVIPDEPFDYTNASAYEISEYAFQKIREYTQSPEDLLEYMDFMSKFPQLSPRNVALIHEQWRGANAVATYDQWQAMGEALGVKPEDVIQTKAIYTNKRTGETKEVVHQGLSVKTGEKSQITLFRPLMVKMIPVLDENGQQLKNDKGNPKFKKLSEATPQEKALVKDGKLPVRQFQERDPKTSYPRFTTYKVFELSQTTLKPESYPKAMPNRHYNFNMDKVKTKEVLEGLCDYAESIGVKMMKDEAHVLGNAKGAFYPGEQLILINPDNTPGEKIATTIHELAHATLHNPKLVDQYKELPKGQKEFEAEMTSHLLSKHFGLDTSEKAIDYMAGWTNNLKILDDKQLADSLKRVHKTTSQILKQIEVHTKPLQGKNRGQALNFPKAPIKGPSH
ncbi:PBECR4 domain-containing protein [Streptococcus pluranimalium]|uniref:Toprim n=1 Tax=Streptococcus pluranimalium TaxID=82348 RepID=A0A2L0D5S9_9STRE|nr:PBECR4 domain-containing protein [Streptococcus pluranimalium]AUW97145.1 toprim [Streptococcus pluranimalium]